MHFFIIRAIRKSTGSVINIVTALPYVDEHGKMYTQDVLAMQIKFIADSVRESNMFDGWEIKVCPAAQEDITDFEDFLTICDAQQEKENDQC